jgi:hypothetical protein
MTTVHWIVLTMLVLPVLWECVWYKMTRFQWSMQISLFLILLPVRDSNTKCDDCNKDEFCHGLLRFLSSVQGCQMPLVYPQFCLKKQKCVPNINKLVWTICRFRGGSDIRRGQRVGGPPWFLTELVAKMFVLVHFLFRRKTETSKNCPDTLFGPIWVLLHDFGQLLAFCFYLYVFGQFLAIFVNFFTL